MDNFVLPGLRQQLACRCRVQSAIVRFGEAITHGHYVIWTRDPVANGWVRISDTQNTKYACFVNTENNIQFYFFKLL
jgi:uncharacterized UBP type Zn finger protein